MEECGVKRAKAIKMIKERRGKFVKECEIYFSNGDLNCKPKTVGKQKMDTALSFENLNIISKEPPHINLCDINFHFVFINYKIWHPLTPVNLLDSM